MASYNICEFTKKRKMGHKTKEFLDICLGGAREIVQAVLQRFERKFQR